LKTVVFESSSELDSIESHTFSGCSNLESIEIPNSVKLIDESAFFGCTKLSKIRIPKDINSINYHTFGNCDGLVSVELSENTTTIDRSAFWGCSKLSAIDLHRVTFIGYLAFCECASLETAYVKAPVIGFQTFYGCERLKKIIFSENVYAVDDEAFRGCALETVLFLSSTAKISQSAFSSPFTAYVPLGSSSWYRSQLPSSCTIIETDFEQNIDIEQENDLTQ
jgi:hypothetical protein